MKAKIYEVASTESVYLVKATTVNQAIRYITDKTISGRVASQERLVELVQEGVTVLDATATVDTPDLHFAEVGEPQTTTTGEIF